MLSAYNTIINAITGYSPFFIVHGREARSPTDQWMKDYVDQLHNHTLAEYILELQQVLLDAWEIEVDRKTHAQGHIQQIQTILRPIASRSSCKADAPGRTSWYVNYLR
jgi:hypothetical protein